MRAFTLRSIDFYVVEYPFESLVLWLSKSQISLQSQLMAAAADVADDGSDFFFILKNRFAIVFVLEATLRGKSSTNPCALCLLRYCLFAETSSSLKFFLTFPCSVCRLCEGGKSLLRAFCRSPSKMVIQREKV